MAEYITKEALRAFPIRENHCDKEHANEHFICGIESVMEYAEGLPAADVAPVVHGRWDSVKNPQWPAYSHDKCNVCGWWNTKNALCYDGNHKPGHSLNFCPNCGAKMDEGDADENKNPEN